MTIRRYFKGQDGLEVELTVSLQGGRVQWFTYIVPKTKMSPKKVEFNRLEVI